MATKSEPKAEPQTNGGPVETIGDRMKAAEAEQGQPEAPEAPESPEKDQPPAAQLPDTARLAAIPGKWANPPAEMISKLPRYTGSKDQRPQKSHCNECGGYHEQPSVHLDYLGHADTTLALIQVDPLWSWEPMKWSEDGSGPFMVNKNGRLVMWGWLTVLGKRILGVGTCEANKSEPEKEIVGDLIRNIASRFGIATGLWSKAEVHSATDEPQRQPKPQSRGNRPQGQAQDKPQGQAKPAAQGPPPPPVPVDLTEGVGAIYDLVLTQEADVQAKILAKATERGLVWDDVSTWKGADLKVMAAFLASCQPKPTAPSRQPQHEPSGPS